MVVERLRVGRPPLGPPCIHPLAPQADRTPASFSKIEGWAPDQFRGVKLGRLGASDGVSRPGGLTTFTFRVLRPYQIARTAFELRDVMLVDADGRTIANSAGVAFPLEELGVPVSPELLPNYPSPFNPETWFPYRLSESSEVAITIYDTLGRVVRRLDLGSQPAGLYKSRSRAAYWNGRNAVGEAVSSGTYVVELRAGSYRAIRRLLIAR
jgi:hypothetical protein